VLGKTASESPGATAYSLTFFPLAAGSYQAELITLSPTAVQIAGFGSNVPTYTMTPVPEPQSVAMALAGLGVAGLMLRRRAASNV
jgi:MYXO-CTERM domain-containing protein